MGIITIIKNEKGFTLIELLMVLALIGLVIGAVISFIFYGLESFTTSDQQSKIQREVRLAVMQINREVRNAYEMGLYQTVGEASIPNPVPADSELNYILLEDEMVKRITSNGKRNLTSAVIESLEFHLLQASSGKNLLEISIEAREGKRTYTVNTEVLLNNLNNLAENLQANQVIAYKKY